MNHVTTVKGLGEKGAENSILTECFKAKDKRAVHKQYSLVGDYFLTEI